MEINPNNLNDVVNELRKFIEKSGTAVGQQLTVPLSGLKELNSVHEIISVDTSEKKELCMRILRITLAVIQSVHLSN
jgi:hypothetical protein